MGLDVMKGMVLLRTLHGLCSLPDFQAELEELKFLEKDGCSKAGGFYYLSGRSELAFESQEDLLPLWGFEASKEGVLEMISHCAKSCMRRKCKGFSMPSTASLVCQTRLASEYMLQNGEADGDPPQHLRCDPHCR